MAQPLNKNAGFREKLQRYIAAGKIPIQREGVLFFNTIYEDEVIVNTSRIAGVDVLDPWALSEAENLGREQVYALYEFFKKEIPGFAQARLVAVGQRMGIRESRRIVGEYVLTGRGYPGPAALPRCGGSQLLPRRHPQPGARGKQRRCVALSRRDL